MTLVYTADQNGVGQILVSHVLSDMKTGNYVVSPEGFNALREELVRYCATLRPKPRVPVYKPLAEGIPTLHGDDVIRLRGRGLMVALNLTRQPVEDIEVGDCVRFDAETRAAKSASPDPNAAVNPKKVYQVIGVEVLRRSDPRRGLQVREIGEDLPDE